MLAHAWYYHAADAKQLYASWNLLYGLGLAPVLCLAEKEKWRGRIWQLLVGAAAVAWAYTTLGPDEVGAATTRAFGVAVAVQSVVLLYCCALIRRAADCRPAALVACLGLVGGVAAAAAAPFDAGQLLFLIGVNAWLGGCLLFFLMSSVLVFRKLVAQKQAAK